MRRVAACLMPELVSCCTSVTWPFSVTVTRKPGRKGCRINFVFAGFIDRIWGGSELFCLRDLRLRYTKFRDGARIMKATYYPGIHKFSIFVVCWTVLLLTAGAIVTSKDAALSVADWPTSFGRYIPPLRLLTGGAFYEHSHRVIAFVLGIFVVILAGLL